VSISEALITTLYKCQPLSAFVIELLLIFSSDHMSVQSCTDCCSTIIMALTCCRFPLFLCLSLSSLPFLSDSLYQNPDSYDSCASMWLEVATSVDAPYAEIVLYSLMNTVLGGCRTLYSPSYWANLSMNTQWHGINSILMWFRIRYTAVVVVCTHTSYIPPFTL
jgi:hypothetical protein